MGRGWIAERAIPHPRSDHFCLHLGMPAIVAACMAVLLVIPKRHRPRAAHVDRVAQCCPILVWRRTSVLSACDM